jgi:hypothetical protein
MSDPTTPDGGEQLTDLQQLDKFINNLKVMKGGSNRVEKKKGGDLTYLQELNTLITNMKGRVGLPSSNKKGITDITNLEKFVTDWRGGTQKDDKSETPASVSPFQMTEEKIKEFFNSITTDTIQNLLNENTTTATTTTTPKTMQSLNTELLEILNNISDASSSTSSLNILRAKMCYFAVLGGIDPNAFKVTEAQYELINRKYTPYIDFFSKENGVEINFTIPNNEISLSFIDKLAIYEEKQKFLKEKSA